MSTLAVLTPSIIIIDDDQAAQGWKISSRGYATSAAAERLWLSVAMGERRSRSCPNGPPRALARWDEVSVLERTAAGLRKVGVGRGGAPGDQALRFGHPVHPFVH
jgi:hypothetical protein